MVDFGQITCDFENKGPNSGYFIPEENRCIRNNPDNKLLKIIDSESNKVISTTSASRDWNSDLNKIYGTEIGDNIWAQCDNGESHYFDPETQLCQPRRSGEACTYLNTDGKKKYGVIDYNGDCVQPNITDLACDYRSNSYVKGALDEENVCRQSRRGVNFDRDDNNQIFTEKNKSYFRLLRPDTFKKNNPDLPIYDENLEEILDTPEVNPDDDIPDDIPDNDIPDDDIPDDVLEEIIKEDGDSSWLFWTILAILFVVILTIVAAIIGLAVYTNKDKSEVFDTFY